jgi:Arc-like DNA binding domain
MVRKSQELRPVMTRIPEGLRRRLEREAELNRRSMNTEIVHRLDESFQTEEAYGGRHMSAMFRALASHLALASAKAGRDWAKNDQVRDEIAQAFVDLLAKNLPQFHSVWIRTVGQHGEIRGVVGYASKESEERIRQGIEEMLKQDRVHLPSSSAHTERDDSK